MSNNSLEDFVWDRVIDESQNRARDNDLRDEYDRQMSDRSYNNNMVKECYEHVMRLILMNWDSCRNQRDEDDLIAKAVSEGVTQHIGWWVTGDRQLADSIADDRMYRDLQGAAAEYEAMERDYEDFDRGSRRGGRGGRDDRGRGRGGRDDRDSRGTGYRQSRPVTSSRQTRDDRRTVGGSRMNGGFGGQRTNDTNNVRDARDRNTRDDRQERQLPNRSAGGMSRPLQQRQEEPAVQDTRHQPLNDTRHEGPDFTQERPYDDFYAQGEHWQLAHKSEWAWTWTPKQQFCRTYNPELEVRFLVKSEDGKTVREEFLQMNDDLNYAAHEIKELHRPNSGRRTRSTGDNGQEITLPGEDLDVVDLNNIKDVQAAARLVMLGDMNLNSIARAEKPMVVATDSDSLIEATGLRLIEGKDIGAVQGMSVEIMPTSGAGREELASLVQTISADTDLLTLQKRLISLRGKVDESVMDAIDTHYTRETNHWLKHYFGFETLSVESFIGDFADLLEVITKRRSQAFTQQFLQRTRNVVISLLVVVEEAGVGELLDSRDIITALDEAPEAYAAFRKNAIGLVALNSAVSVNIDAEAFGLVDDVVRVPPKEGQNADAELRTVLESLYRLGRQVSSTGRVLLNTGDNLRFELVGVAGARDVVGIRRA